MARPFFAYAVLGLLMVFAGCSGSRNSEVPLDQRFGTRSSSGGEEVVVINPPDTTTTYFYYPAVYDTLHIRVAPFEAGGTDVPVELLVKGSFPDACMELHAVEQERAGNLLTMNLQMRRPQGALCASVVRPYRFYILLQGRYGAGGYRLLFNDDVHTFTVREPAS